MAVFIAFGFFWYFEKSNFLLNLGAFLGYSAAGLYPIEITGKFFLFKIDVLIFKGY